MKRGDRVRYGYADEAKKPFVGVVIGVMELRVGTVISIETDEGDRIFRYERDVELLDAGD